MRYILPFILLFSSTLLAESSLSFSTSTDRTSLSVGETLIYRMQLKGADIQSIPSFSPPELGTHFQIVGSEESVTYQLMNGNLNAVKIRSLRLRAMAEGNVDIPPAELRIGKEVLKSQPIRIQISASKTSPELNNPTATDANSPVLLKIQTNKKTAYVGEQIQVEVLLHRRVSFFGNPQFEPLQIPGSLTETLPVDDQTTESTLNGHRFYTNSIQKLIVTPLSPGILRIPASRLGFHTGPFDRMKVIESPVTELQIKALPTLPEGLSYSGVVGEFEWRIRVDEKKVQQLSPIVVAFNITGKGNLKPLTDLKVSENQDVRLYRSKSLDSSSKTAEGNVQQEKQLEYIVVPQIAGELTLPTFSWTYFSPRHGQYITLRSPQMTLHVMPTSANIAHTSTAARPPLADTDIRYLKPLTKNKFEGVAIPFLWGGLLIAFISGISTWLWLRFRKKDPITERKQKAYSTALKALKELREHPTEKGLSRAQTVLLEFLGDRLGMSFLGLTHPEIKSHLTKAAIDELLIVNTLDVLEKLAFALYAPSRVDSQSKAALIGEAEALLSQLKVL
jgi:hypothetical protein